MDKNYVIFDMDGTLVDSMPKWQGLGREFLGSRGVKNIPEDVLGRMRHRTVLEAGAVLIEDFGLKETPQQVADGINAIMTEHYKTDVELKPGVRAYLDRLKEKGVRMCVASATARPLMEICLKRLGVLDYFEGILSCVDIGVGKHRPDVYYAAAGVLGAEPGDIAVFEDDLRAAGTAKQAGFYVVGVYEETVREEWQQVCALVDEAVPDWRKIK